MSSPTRVLANPRSGGAVASGLLTRLGTRSDIELRIPDGPDALTAEARRAADEGLERVVVLGGDGTVHHAIRGLAGTATALGIVPLGTGNDLARALDLPRDPQRALEHACTGPVRTIDLGRVDGKPFVGIAAIGFDGEVLERMRVKRRVLRGAAAYAYAVLRTLATFRVPTLAVDAPDVDFGGPALLAAVANSPVFGGGMRIAPQATLDDGWLDLVIVRPVGLADALRLFPRVYRGTHVAHPAVTCRRVRRATLRADRELTVNGDGEPLARAGTHGTLVDVWPGSLRVVAD